MRSSGVSPSNGPVTIRPIAATSTPSTWMSFAAVTARTGWAMVARFGGGVVGHVFAEPVRRQVLAAHVDGGAGRGEQPGAVGGLPPHERAPEPSPRQRLGRRDAPGLPGHHLLARGGCARQKHIGVRGPSGARQPHRHGGAHGVADHGDAAGAVGLRSQCVECAAGIGGLVGEGRCEVLAARLGDAARRSAARRPLVARPVASVLATSRRWPGMFESRSSGPLPLSSSAAGCGPGSSGTDTVPSRRTSPDHISMIRSIMARASSTTALGRCRRLIIGSS